MNTLYRAYHNVHGMIPEEEYFTLEDAVNGDLTFFGSPAKDFDTHDFVFMLYIGAHDRKKQDIFIGDYLGSYTSTGKLYKTYRVEISTKIHNVDGMGFTYYGVHLVNTELDFDVVSGFDWEILEEMEVLGNSCEGIVVRVV